MFAAIQAYKSIGFMERYAWITFRQWQAKAIKILEGTHEFLGVGEANLTVEANGIKTTSQITISLKKILENAKQVNGITYVPIKSVFQALGGTSSYTASTKVYNIKVETRLLRLPKEARKLRSMAK